jgi:tetratricopeptide (TPR) repeat protein
MKNQVKYIQNCLWAGILSVSLWACSQDGKQGMAIPALPDFAEKARRDVALRMLTAAINSNPSNGDTYLKRAYLYLENNQLNEALADVKQAIENDPKQDRYHLCKALILRDSQKPIEALTAAIKSESLGNKTPEIYTLLGDLYQQTKQYDRAQRYLDKSLQISPNNGETYYFSGLMTAKRGDTLGAIPILEKSLTLKPSFLKTYLTFSDLYTNFRRYPEALSYSALGLKYHPRSAELYFRRGYTYQRIWRLDSALICYASAIRQDPTMYRASFQAGALYFKVKNYRAALTQFTHTYKYKPDLPNLLNILGQCYEYTGDLNKAEELYTLATSKDAGDYRSLNALWRVKRKLLYGDSAVYDYQQPLVPKAAYALPEQRRLDTMHVPKIKMPTKLKADSLLRRMNGIN